MNKIKILIIDDDDNMRRALHIRFKAAGYDTAFAADGLTAMNAALEHVVGRDVLCIRSQCMRTLQLTRIL